MIMALESPTLIAIAEPASWGRTAGGEGALRFFSTVGGTLHRVLNSGLPVLLVCDERCAESVHDLIPENRVLRLGFKSNNVADQHVEALVAGVLAQPNAGGWLALPCAIPMIENATLQRVAAALGSYPVAYAEYQQQQGYPIGFSAELFSELIQVNSLRELERVIVRYPSHRVEVEDPGVLLAPQGLRRSGEPFGTSETVLHGQILQRRY